MGNYLVILLHGMLSGIASCYLVHWVEGLKRGKRNRVRLHRGKLIGCCCNAETLLQKSRVLGAPRSAIALVTKPRKRTTIPRCIRVKMITAADIHCDTYPEVRSRFQCLPLYEALLWCTQIGDMQMTATASSP